MAEKVIAKAYESTLNNSKALETALSGYLEIIRKNKAELLQAKEPQPETESQQPQEEPYEEDYEDEGEEQSAQKGMNQVMNTKNDVEVIINGRTYIISGYESSEYMQKIATHINSKYDEFKKSDSFPKLDQEF